MLGHNVQAVSELYTRTAKMLGKCPVSDCYLELWSERSFAGVVYLVYCSCMNVKNWSFQTSSAGLTFNGIPSLRYTNVQNSAKIIIIQSYLFHLAVKRN